jgi:hypothetical protein
MSHQKKVSVDEHVELYYHSFMFHFFCTPAALLLCMGSLSGASISLCFSNLTVMPTQFSVDVNAESPLATLLECQILTFKTLSLHHFSKMIMAVLWL